jgi:hypothetical protein
MPDASDSSEQFDSSPSPRSVADRVEQRLILAGFAFDRRLGASRPRNQRRKTKPALAPSVETATPAAPVDPRERACLRMVFRDLGDAHRQYRARTGMTGTPALRAAANAFKLEPSVGRLVPVATQLDELGILGW